MHDGWIQSDDGTTDGATAEDSMDRYLSSSSQEHHLDGFVMDAFALDFDGQGVALYSLKLLRQAEFFTKAVETIIEGCHLSDDARGGNGKPRGVTIVAHSIGAWVIRIALKMYPHLSKDGWIRNVVTLASPLGSVPYGCWCSQHCTTH